MAGDSLQGNALSSLSSSSLPSPLTPATRGRSLGRYASVSLGTLASVESLILFAAIYGVLSLCCANGKSMFRLPVGTLGIWLEAMTFVLVMLATMSAFGLYLRENQEDQLHYYTRCAISFVVGASLAAALFRAIPGLSIDRELFWLAVLLAFAGHLGARFTFLQLTNQDACKRRILVLGAGCDALSIAELERIKGTAHPLRVVGYLPFNSEPHAVDSTLILQDTGTLPDFVHNCQIDEIVVAARDRRGADISMSELLECKCRGVTITNLTSFLERETGRVELESTHPSWFVFSEGFHRGWLKRLVKRLFDMLLGTVLLAITLLLMGATILLIWLEDGRPILYRQQRIGQWGRPFDLIKFRSMRINAERDGEPQWASRHDPRCTLVGRIIRKLRIDELPQLINVLKGDMSLVGPRPERALFVERLAPQIRYYSYRHSVKPGITGWAQIRYPYGASPEEAKEKLKYDLYYVKNHNLFLDLCILLQTVHIVLFGKGAR